MTASILRKQVIINPLKLEASGKVTLIKSISQERERNVKKNGSTANVIYIHAVC